MEARAISSFTREGTRTWLSWTRLGNKYNYFLLTVIFSNDCYFFTVLLSTAANPKLDTEGETQMLNSVKSPHN